MSERAPYETLTALLNELRGVLGPLPRRVGQAYTAQDFQIMREQFIALGQIAEHGKAACDRAIKVGVPIGHLLPAGIPDHHWTLPQLKRYLDVMEHPDRKDLRDYMNHGALLRAIHAEILRREPGAIRPGTHTRVGPLRDQARALGIVGPNSMNARTLHRKINEAIDELQGGRR